MVILFVHFFLSNIFGCNVIPNIIEYKGRKYFSQYYKGLDEVHHIKYTYDINENSEVDTILDVSNFTKYTVFLKAISELWKMRKEVRFSIDYF